MASNPHDAPFKAVFGQPEHARGLLRAALPDALSAALDWSTLSRCPGSFVDSGLHERHTDLLFSARMRGGGETLVYLLFEHQSTPDPHMAYRLLRYMQRACTCRSSRTWSKIFRRSRSKCFADGR